jgi:hypothetical protein
MASADPPKSYRVNTGKVVFVPFTASSIEETMEFVRQSHNQHYAGRRWLQVKENGVFG